MIATLTGKLLIKGLDRAVVDVQGVGYEVILSTDGVARLPDIEEPVFLFVHTNVREDAITLFGFLEDEEKELFLILKTVSGIGPKLALAMLSGLRVSEICQAITQGDIKKLTTLSGVGKKTAERICVDLKEKVSHLIADMTTSTIGMGAAPIPERGGVEADVLSALTNLGYSENVAQGALVSVKERLDLDEYNELDIGALIREALRLLA